MKHISKSKCTKQTMLGPLLEVEMLKKIEKVHAVVARSTFPTQKCKKLMGSDHSWKMRCRKSARPCGAKHMFKSKCTKRTILEAEMLKKIKRVHAVVAKHISNSKVSKTDGVEPFLTFRCPKKCTLTTLTNLTTLTSLTNLTNLTTLTN